MKPFTKKEEQKAKAIFEELRAEAIDRGVYSCENEWKDNTTRFQTGWKIVARWHLNEVKRLKKTPSECAT